jgi:hypothetical protein
MSVVSYAKSALVETNNKSPGVHDMFASFRPLAVRTATSKQHHGWRFKRRNPHNYKLPPPNADSINDTASTAEWLMTTSFVCHADLLQASDTSQPYGRSHLESDPDPLLIFEPSCHSDLIKPEHGWLVRGAEVGTV